jgi:Ca2+-binding EF-hand superfamily protein
MMIKSQIRKQAKDLSLMFKRADVDGSGELDEEELKSMLYRANIVFEERHFDVLMSKIDADGSGSVSYQEFMKYFAKGGKDDKELSRAVTGISVPQAKQMIREKIEGRMEGGPAGLRRAFQMFDGDGSGSISKQEFIDTLKLHCMLEFEKPIIDACLKDMAGDEMNFNEFTTIVLGSSNADRASVGPSLSAMSQVNDDNGNSEQMIRRKVREHWKSLHVAFKHGDRYQTGKIDVNLLKRVLDNHQINLPDRLWDEVIEKLDPKNTNKVSYTEFLKPYSKGSDFDKQAMATLKVSSKAEAKKMIQDKLEGRIQGGPAGLRRAFQFFDRDGGNSISKEELQKALSEYLGLVFEDSMVSELFDDFRGDKEDIDFAGFTKNVMGSSTTGATGLDSRSLRTNSKVSDFVTKGVNDPMFLRRKVREHWKDLQFAFRHADKNENGIITPEQLRWELGRCDIIIADSQFADLLKSIDKDGDGEVSYEEFFDHFGKGQDDEKLSALVGTITERTTSLPQAKELIREKMRGRLSGGPSELRRTFQLFDGDGGGSIDCEEFEEALKVTCGLQFEKTLVEKIMNDFSRGTGEMDFQCFTEAVMESKKTDSTSFGQHMTAAMVESDNDGNSLQFVIRKVNERFKDLKIAFKHVCDQDGFCTPPQLRETLFRFDIVMSDAGFKSMLKQLDENGDGKIHFTEFMALFGPGRKDAKSAISTITSMSLPKAMELIQEKIRGRLAGGPSEMRRAFQFFDRDGGGTIDLDEFAKGLEQFCGLRFSKPILEGLMNSWDDDKSGELDYVKFCKAVMGSTGAAAETSFVNDSNARSAATDAQGNSAQFLRRKIRQKMKDLVIDFRQRGDKDGNLTPQQLKDILYKHDIIFADKDFAQMVADMDEDGDGDLSYHEFLNYFKPGQADEKVTAAEVDNVDPTIAIRMIREKVEGRLQGGPAGLRRAWRVFDDSKAGEVKLDQFAEICLKVVGINFSKRILGAIMAILDDDGSGSVDYRKFCENLMGSNRKSLTSMTDNAAQGAVSDDHGNSDQFLRRKVRTAWKQLINVFQHESDSEGNLSPQQLRDVLFRFDIIMADKQFTEMIAAMDEDGDGELSYQEFLQYFAVGTDHDKAITSTITNMSIATAKNVIRDKMRGRLAGGPAEIRRSFQFFDRDGSGAIDMEEFAAGLQTYCGLKFEEKFLRELMAEFDDGSGEISYISFAELVMESSPDDVGLASPSGKIATGPKRGRPINLILAEIEDKATMKGVALLPVMRAFDDTGAGKITHEEFLKALLQVGVKLIPVEQKLLLRGVDPENVGTIEYVEFAQNVQPASPAGNGGPFVGAEETKEKTALAGHQDITGIGQDTIQGIKQFIIEKVEQNHTNIASVFRKFDDDKSGHLSYDEFRKGLLYMGVPLNNKEFDLLCKEVDNDGGGDIDYAEFVEDMKDNDMGANLVEERQRTRGPQAEVIAAVGIGQNTIFGIKKFIIDKVEQNNTSIRAVFRKFDDDKSGHLNYDEFRKGLLYMGVPLNDKEFDLLCKEVDNDGGGDIDYAEFVEDMQESAVHTVQIGSDAARPKKAAAAHQDSVGIGQNSNPAEVEIIHQHARSSAPPAQAMEAKGIGITDPIAIKDYIVTKVEGKSPSIHTVFLNFDEDKSGVLSHDEFRRGLLYLGIPLNDTEFKILVAETDSDGSGTIDYNEFVAEVKDVDAQTEDMFPEPEDMGPAVVPLDTTTGIGLSGAQEILAFVQDKLAKTGQSLGALFINFEGGRDSGIGYDDVRSGLLRLGIPLNDAEFKALINAWDPDGSGNVAYDEFTDDVLIPDRSSKGAAFESLSPSRSQTSRGSVGSRSSRPPSWRSERGSPSRMMEVVPEDAMGAVSGTALLSKLDRRVSDARRRSSVQASGTDAALAAMLASKGGNRRKPSLADYGNSSLRA